MIVEQAFTGTARGYHFPAGSLVWVSPTVALTAAHVATLGSVYAKDTDGYMVAPTVTLFDPALEIPADGRLQPAQMERDLAALTFDRLMTDVWARLDDDGFTSGAATLTGWRAGIYYDERSGNSEQITNFTIRENPAQSFGGQSGGGIFDDEGELVGIVSTTMYAVDLRAEQRSFADRAIAEGWPAARGYLAAAWSAVEPHPERYGEAASWCAANQVPVTLIASITGFTEQQIAGVM